MKNKKTLKRTLSLIKPYGFFVAVSTLCAIVSVASTLLIPYFTADAIDNMISAGEVFYDGVLKAAALVGITAVLSALAQYFLSVSNNKVAYGISADIRDKLSLKLQALPLSYLDKHPSGDLISRIITDVESFSDGLLMGFTQLFTAVITVVATVVIMLIINPLIAVTVLILTPMSLFVARFIALKTHKYFVSQAVVRGKQTALINELIAGQREVKAFGHEKESLNDFEKINNELQKVTMNATFFSSLVNPSTRLVNNIVYAFVALISGFSALSGAITVGQISIFLSYASQYAKPFNDISAVVTEMQNALTCAARVFELLDEDEEPKEAETPSDPERTGVAELQNVFFSYNKEKPFIENLTIKAKKGQTVAIVGPTGCGKTTIINLLMRFYDADKGVIKVDGEDIQNMTRHNLRSRYTMVLQDTWLFKGSVKENIAYGKPDATDEEIENAARASYAHSFIKRLPMGYDTLITDGGSNLSAGQRQLLCIARVMLCRPPMLILDEATSSIDTRTELKIRKAFSTLMKDRTSFVVAHRLSTVKEADIILVMKDGKIIEKGSHDELMAQNGFYNKLYNSQFEVI